MRFHLVRPRELDASAVAAWRSLQQAEPSLASPYFAPEFTLAVDAVRDDVFVTVLEQDHRIVGFFPFQRDRWGAGGPVGGRLSDHHGVIASRSTPWSWGGLLKSSRIGYWHFDHLAGWQVPDGASKPDVSHALDLSGGYSAYRNQKIASGSEAILKLERRSRTLEREIGPMRFVPNTPDDAVLETVIRLKLAQCRRTGSIEYFNWPWTRGLVERIRRMDEPAFGGRLSALYVGDTLVAAHFGMRTPRVWHGWFTAYDHAWATWSPGSLLLLRMAQAAGDEGHQLLDLGKGEEPFKKVFGNVQLPLAVGCATRASVANSIRLARMALGRAVRSSPLAPLAQILRRSVRLSDPS